MGYTAVLATADNLDPNALFVRIVGHSMEPHLGDGWVVRADTTRVQPQSGEVVVIDVVGEGGFIGYWSGGDAPALLKANPDYPPLDLTGKAMAHSRCGHEDRRSPDHSARGRDVTPLEALYMA